MAWHGLAVQSEAGAAGCEPRVMRPPDLRFASRFHPARLVGDER